MRLALVLAVAGCSGAAPTTASSPPGDRAERSRELFGQISQVLLSPRCVNCHPPDDAPRQRDAHELHDPPVVRGTDDRGVVAMRCTTCHQDTNATLARVPGAPDWHLAPRAMAWLDRTPAEICVQIKDPARNGGRTLAQLHDHVANDKLVAWGWTPGADRAPAPGTQAELAALVQAWIDSGAECPR